MIVDLDGSVRGYWRDRLGQHFDNRYRGRQLVKFPEDLMTYQDVIWETRPEVIVELGSGDGGSALWFADQLTAICGSGWVISVDALGSPDISDERIAFVHGDLRTVVLPEVMPDARVMVVEDSAHTHDVTLAALRRYSPLVPKGCYFVVEDTVVDTDLSIWPGVKGAGMAVADFLAGEPRFEARDRSAHGLTMNMGGWLEAVA